MTHPPKHGKNSRAQGAEDLIVDRLRVGTRTLLAAGHAVDVEAVIVGAGLQFHPDRRRFAGVVAWMAEQMAPQFARTGRNDWKGD